MKTAHNFRMYQNAAYLMLFLAAIVWPSRHVEAQFCSVSSVSLTSKSTSTNKEKCGFGECQLSWPPKRFLRQIDVDLKLFEHWPSSSYAKSYFKHEQWYERLTCYMGEAYSGQASRREVIEPPVYVCCSGSVVDPLMGTWDDGGGCASYWANYWVIGLLNCGYFEPDEIYYYYNCASQLEHGYSVGQNEMTYVRDEWIGVRSKPYTDEMLRADVIALLPPYPEEWTPGSGVAFWYLSEDHLYASGGKMLNRFTIPNTEKGVTYRVKWQEQILYPNRPPSRRSKAKEVKGTGDPNNPAYVEDEVDVPKDECAIVVLEDSIAVEVVSVPGAGSWSAPGTGSVGTGGGNGGCNGPFCSSGTGVSGGPALWISLGPAGINGSAGQIGFSSSKPSPELYTPLTLYCTAGDSSDVELIRAEVYTTNIVPDKDVQILTDAVVVTNDGAIWTNVHYTIEVLDVTNSAIYTNLALRQVKAPQVLADIVPVTYGYEIRFYWLWQVGSSKVDNIYPILDPSPFVTWRVENPNPTTTNQLRITETRQSQGVVGRWDYSYTPETGAWKLQPAGDEIEVEIFSTSIGDMLQELSLWRKPGGTEVYRVKRIYQKYYTGQYAASVPVEGEVLVQEAIGPEDAPQITAYTYHDQWAFGTTGRRLLKTVTHPDGSWVYYDWYDQNGNPLAVYSAFGDAALDEYWNGRLTEYFYGPGYGDDGTIRPETPRKVVESVQGQVLSCRYTLFPSIDTRLDIQCINPYASWDDPSNLFTTNHYYTQGPNQFALKAVVHPDKTLTTYDYATNVAGTLRTNIVAHGLPDPSYTTVLTRIFHQRERDDVDE